MIKRLLSTQALSTLALCSALFVGAHVGCASKYNLEKRVVQTNTNNSFEAHQTKEEMVVEQEEQKHDFFRFKQKARERLYDDFVVFHDFFAQSFAQYATECRMDFFSCVKRLEEGYSSLHPDECAKFVKYTQGWVGEIEYEVESLWAIAQISGIVSSKATRLESNTQEGSLEELYDGLKEKMKQFHSQVDSYKCY